MSETYSVVMTGKIADGFEMDQVKASVGGLFKLNNDQLNKMFSGKPVAIRRGLDKQQALKLRAVLTKAGALAVVKVMRPAGEAKSSTPKQAVAASPDVAPVATNNEQEAPAPEICCPRCGHQQPFATACSLCKMDLNLHIQRLRRKERARQARNQAAG